ncbi:MAG: hypothetical protein LBR36_00045 [Bacteroidales bacterium]|jgi:tetratricopeptide (TPR) repeat protein|nr:hypothetical protein [Bacteroidales bacterium]
MKKIFYLLFCIPFLLYSVDAQNLSISDPIVISDGNDDRACASSYKISDACITFIAPAGVELSFKSNVDPDIKILNSRVNGPIREYILAFNTDNHYHNLDRKIEISSKESPLPLEITPVLSPKMALQFVISLIECSQPLYNDAMKLYAEQRYDEAKELFDKAQKCYDAPLINEELITKLQAIDSIVVWYHKAKESELLLDYENAALYYGKIQTINSLDKKASAKYREMTRQISYYCQKYFHRAEFFFKHKEFEKAQILYKRMLEMDCSGKKDTCLQKLQDCEKELKGDKLLEGVFTYEFGISRHQKPYLMLPIGIHLGKYRNHGAGVYWSLTTNTEFFNMLLKDYPKAVRADIGMQLGLNVRLVPKEVTKYFPVWLHFGAGYHLMGAFTYKNADEEEIRYEGGDLSAEKLKAVPYHVPIAEAGMTVKITRLVLRYTFSYRITNEEKRNYVQPFMHSVGIGVCW